MRETRYGLALSVTKNEIDLLKEACLFGADADENIENARKKGGKYEVSFLFEELDDLAGYVASCANHEESEQKQKQWDKLYDKIDELLELSQEIDTSNITPIFEKQPCSLKYYIFDVWIEKANIYDNLEGKILRKIQIAGTKSLYNFAKTITQAFGFYFDHCFGFYDNFQRRHDSKEAYELFVDIGEEPSSPKIKGVKKTDVQQAFNKPGKKMLFFFDYGDCWYFGVELKEIKNAEKWDLKPVILETIGEAPMQYPPYDEPEAIDE